jgi:hypothetical protein
MMREELMFALYFAPWLLGVEKGVERMVTG